MATMIGNPILRGCNADPSIVCVAEDCDAATLPLDW